MVKLANVIDILWRAFCLLHKGKNEYSIMYYLAIWLLKIWLFLFELSRVRGYPRGHIFLRLVADVVPQSSTSSCN